MGKFREPETAEDYLLFAEEAERTMQDCGPHDPAYYVFKLDRDFYLDQAVKMEKEKAE